MTILKKTKTKAKTDVGSEKLFLCCFAPDIVSFVHCRLASYQYLAYFGRLFFIYRTVFLRLLINISNL